MNKVFGILVLVLTVLMSSNLVSAADDMVYSSESTIAFKGACVYNGSYCSSSTMCNISAFYPNGAIYINNQPTTNQVTFYNRTLPQTFTLGQYSAKLVCYDPVAGFSGVEDFVFTVTSTGGTSGGNMTIFILLIAVAVIVFVMSFFMHNEYIGALSGFLLASAGMYLLIYGIGIETNLYTRGVGYVLIGLGIIIIMISTWEKVTSGDGYAIGSTKEDENDVFNYKQEKEAD
jgi:hypothetical protein